MKSSPAHLPLYRYRFWIGFGLVAILTIALTVWNFWRLPNGLTSGEILTASRSGGLNLGGILRGIGDFTNLPFLILQKTSIEILGFSTLALRLPSVILSLLSIAMLAVALVYYERKNVSVISVFLLFTSPLFLSLARSSGAGSMTVFLLLAIILSAVLLLSGQFHSWRSAGLKLAMCLAAALLLYSPGGLIVVAALIVIGLWHPKSRYEVFRNKRYKLLLGLLLALVVITPLAISLARQHYVLEILGINGWTVANFCASWNLWFTGNKLVGGFMTPLFNIEVVALAFYGVVRLARALSAARARLVLPLLLLTLLLTFGDPRLAFWLFVPISMALATGVSGLLSAWYDLFPRNPYARTFALLAVALLVVIAGFSSVGNYFANNFYSRPVITALNRQFEAVRTAAADHQKHTLLVPADQLTFYRNLTRDFPKLNITSRRPLRSGSTSLLVVSDVRPPLSSVPHRLVTDFTVNDAMLLREY
ncbi:MAG: glycosyltransferase family 39 protein [Candidatus Nanoperiomorbaceae bacterium]